MGHEHLVKPKLGRFQVDKQVGLGTYGTVFRAVDPVLHRAVAIKVLHEGFAEVEEELSRFWAEARAMAALEHPSIVPIFEFNRDRSAFYLVMGWKGGGSLRDALERCPTGLPEEVVVRHVRDICGALAVAHSLKIIHRDLKPDNLMLNERGDVAISDFGLARIGESLFKEGEKPKVNGTPNYMAPECWNGASTIDERCDLYALGCLIFELLTGAVPFKAVNLEQLKQAHASGPIPLVSACRDGLKYASVWDQIVSSLLRKEPAARLQSALETLDKFESAISSIDQAQARQRRRQLWAGITLVALALTAVAVHQRSADLEAVDQSERLAKIASETAQKARQAAAAAELRRTALQLESIMSDLRRGVDLAQNSRRAEALVYFSRALALDPGNRIASAWVWHLVVRGIGTEFSEAGNPGGSVLVVSKDQSLACVEREGLVTVQNTSAPVEPADGFAYDKGEQLMFSEDKSIVFGCGSGRLRVWDVSKKTMRLDRAESAEGFRNAQLSPDARFALLTIGPSRKFSRLTGIRIFDVKDGRLVWEHSEIERKIEQCGIAASGRYVVVITGEKGGTRKMTVVDTQSWQPIRPPCEISGELYSIIQTTSRTVVTKTLVDGENIPRVDFHDITNGQISTIQGDGKDEDMVLSVSPSEQAAFVATSRFSRLVDLGTNRSFDLPELARPARWGSFSTAGDKLLIHGHRQLIVWDIKLAAFVGSQIAPGRDVDYAELSPDGWSVLTVSGSNGRVGGESDEVRVWDLSTGAQIGKSIKHPRLRSAHFSPEGLRLLTITGEPSFRLWEALTGEPITDEHRLAVQSYAGFLDHGRLLHSLPLNENGPLPGIMLNTRIKQGFPIPLVMDIPRFRETNVLNTAHNCIIRLSPNGAAAEVSDLTTGNRTMSLTKVGHRIRSLALSQDGGVLVTVGTGELCMWDLGRGGTLLGEIQRDKVSAVQLNSNGSRVLLQLPKGIIEVWDVSDFRRLGQVKHLDSRELKFAPDGRRFYSRHYKRGVAEVNLWETDTCNPIGSMKFSGDSQAIFSPDSRWLCCVTPTKGAEVQGMIFDITSVAQVGETFSINFDCREIAFSPDSTFLVYVGPDGAGRLWDIEKGKPSGKRFAHRGAVTSARFAPNGRTLLTGGQDGMVIEWSLASGTALAEPIEIGGSIRRLSVHPKQREIAVVFSHGESEHMRCWDIQSRLPLGEELFFEKTPGMIYGLNLSAEFDGTGKWIVTRSDGTSVGEVLRLFPTAPNLGRAPANIANIGETISRLVIEADGRVNALSDEILRRRRFEHENAVARLEASPWKELLLWELSRESTWPGSRRPWETAVRDEREIGSLEALLRANSLNPSDPFVLLLIAAKRRYVEAADWLREYAVRLVPTKEGECLQAFALLKEQGAWSLALKVAEVAADVSGGSLSSRRCLGEALVNVGRYQEGKVVLNSIGDSDLDLGGFVASIIASGRLGENARVGVLCNVGDSRYPRNNQLWRAVGRSKLWLGDFLGAAQALENAEEYGPTTPSAELLCERIVAEMMGDQQKEARNTARRLIENYAEFGEPGFALQRSNFGSETERKLIQSALDLSLRKSPSSGSAKDKAR